jgi:hypothetical protein
MSKKKGEKPVQGARHTVHGQGAYQGKENKGESRKHEKDILFFVLS